MRTVTKMGLLLAVCCGGQVDKVALDAASADESNDATDASDAVVACLVDAGSCLIGSHILSCGSGICVTDGAVCPASDGVDDGGCTNACELDEFGAACGGGPIASNAPPLAECRMITEAPNALAFYCCRCGY